MDLKTLTISIYLRNPAHLSANGLPMFVLENGRKIVVKEIDYSEWTHMNVMTYDVYREVGTHGNVLPIEKNLPDLLAVAAILARESMIERETLRTFSGRRG